MKRVVICLLLSATIGLTVNAGEPVEELLSSTQAVHRDEMFHFQVTYSNVHISTNEFRFTQTMLHTEELGTYKVVVTCALPLSVLLAATRTVLANDGIGRNTLVRIDLPETTPAEAISITTETIDEDGNRKAETRTPELFRCEVDFPDKNAAEAWNEALTKFLK